MRRSKRPLVFFAFAATAMAAPAVAHAQVRVTLVTNDPAAVLVANAYVPSERTVRTWAVCRGAGCSAMVDPHWYFHVDGAGITKTPHFWLGQGDDVAVQANTGSSAAHAWGTFFTWTGGLGALAGGSLLGVHLAGRPLSADSDFKSVGLWTLGTSAVLLAFGVPMLLLGRTTVTTHTTTTSKPVAKALEWATKGVSF